MAHKWPSRVRETSGSTGTGAYTLAGAVTGFRTFAAALDDADTVDYCAVLGSGWEVGRGTYSGGVLTRTEVLASSNAGAAVDWPAGTKQVFAIHVGISDLDATGLANLGALFATVTLTGSPSAGQFPRWSAAAQIEARSLAQFQGDIGVDTDGTLAADSDAKIASQKATKTYVDAKSLSGKVIVQVTVFDDSEDCAVGNGAGDVFWPVPDELAAMNLIRAAAHVQTAGVDGAMTVQIYNVTQGADMLSSGLSVASAAKGSGAASIDTDNDDVAANDELRFDVDAVHSTTPAKGLVVTMVFQAP